MDYSVERFESNSDRLAPVYCNHVQVIQLYDLCILRNKLHRNANNYSAMKRKRM